MVFRFLLSIVFIGIASGCSDKESTPEWNYFPLNEGEYRIYDVSESIHTAGMDEILLLRKEEKHVITKVDKESTNNISKAEVVVYSRTDQNESWKLTGTYMTEKKPDQALVIKDGYTVVPLQFPISIGRSWDGNIYNNLEKTNFSITEIRTPYKEWGNTIKILKREKSTLIDYFNSYQRYAHGVGLVYEEDTAYEYCQSDACIGQYKIESGYSKISLLIDYGVE